MNDSIKWVLRALLGVVGLTVILIAYAIIFIDPNDYKEEIAKIVKSQTGRDLKIDGSINLSIFPWTGLEVSKLSLADTNEFSEKTFASIEQLGIRASFWSLLTGKLKAQSLELHGLRLNLELNRKGKFNLTDLMQPQSAESKPAEAAQQAQLEFEIDKVSISDANIQYRDQAAKTTYLLKHLNLATTGLGQPGAKDVSLNFNYVFAKEAKPIHIRYSGKLEYLPKTSSLNMPELTLMLDKLRLKGNLQLNGLGSAMIMQGQLASNEFVPRDLLAKLGTSMSELNDKSSLTKAKVSSAFLLKNDKFSLKNFVLDLDESKINGHLTVDLANAKTPFDFEFLINEIDLDRYQTKVAAQSVSAGASGKSNLSAAAANVSVENSILPERELLALQGNGIVKINKLKTAGLELNNVKLQLKANQGSIHLKPLGANLYGGRYDGDILIRVYKNTMPMIEVKDRFTKIQAGTFTANILPAMIKKIGMEKIDGQMTLEAILKTMGRNAQMFQANVDGRLQFNFENGRTVGVSAIHKVCQLYNLTRNRPMPAYSDKYEKFAELSGAIVFNNGRGEIQKLQMQGHLYAVNASGYIDLRNENFDVQFNIEVENNCDLQQTENQATSKRDLQLKCKGSFNSSKNPCKLDFNKILKKQVLKKLLKSEDAESNSNSGDETKSEKQQLKERLLKELFK